MRAGDEDRQKIADQLKVALDQGRLDLSEYDERLQRAYGAKTYGDLDGLLDDLPGTVPLEKSRIEPLHTKDAKSQARRGRPAYYGPLTAFVICTLVWAMSSLGSGELQYFWPAWVLIPVVVTVMAHLGDRGKRGH